MKQTLKSTLAALGAVIIAVLAISSCATKKNSGTHNMGGPKPAYPMSNDAMAGTR